MSNRFCGFWCGSWVDRRELPQACLAFQFSGWAASRGWGEIADEVGAENCPVRLAPAIFCP